MKTKIPQKEKNREITKSYLEELLNKVVEKKFKIGERPWCIECAKRIRKYILTHANQKKVKMNENSVRFQYAFGRPPHSPYCCPVCGGKGVVPTGFYEGWSGGSSSDFFMPETCRSCNGTGVIWG